MLEQESALGRDTGTAERRRVPRRPKHVLVATGCWLEDESREGAGFLTLGPVPSRGASFTYTVGSRTCTGRVRWIHATGDGTRFGVEKASVRR